MEKLEHAPQRLMMATGVEHTCTPWTNWGARGYMYSTHTMTTTPHPNYKKKSCPIILALFYYTISQKNVPILLKLCQHNWEKPSPETYNDGWS